MDIVEKFVRMRIMLLKGGDFMSPNVVEKVLFALWPMIRPVLVKAVDDPDSEWDDYLLSILDLIFLPARKRGDS